MSIAATDQVAAQPRARYVVRVLLYFVLLAVINVAAFNGVWSLVSPIAPSWVTLLLEGVVYLAGVFALTWTFTRFVDRVPLSSLGLQRTGLVSYVVSGLILGIGIFALAVAVFALSGWLTIEASNTWRQMEFAASLFTYVVIAFNEELAFRGYILQGLGRAWGVPAAVVATSIVFALVHAVNLNANVLGIVTIFFGGVLFAIAYLITRSLWLPIGLHLGWNLAEMHILGLAGSGNVQPSLLQATLNGPELATGGAFGPEGGIVALGAELVGIALLLVGHRIVLSKKQK